MPGPVAALVGALLLGALNTFGDFLWARFVSSHRAPLGLAHGTLLLLALGLYLGAAALLGASVWASALCHGVNNSLSVVLPPLGVALEPGAQVGWALGLAGAGVVLLGVVAGRVRGRGADAAGPGPEAALQREAPPAD